MPKRRGTARKRTILFSVTGAVLILLGIFAVWHRETLYYIANPGKIRFNSAAGIRAALLSGDFGPVAEEDGVLVYRVLDGTAEVRVTLYGDMLERLEVSFNALHIPVRSIPDGLSQARHLLSPFLSPPAVRALGIIISAEMMSHVSSGKIDYSRALDGHTVAVTGSTATGEVFIAAQSGGSI